MRDHAYDRIPYRAPQVEHRYGPAVHIIADPLALTQLAKLCAKGTWQPEINTLSRCSTAISFAWWSTPSSPAGPPRPRPG